MIVKHFYVNLLSKRNSLFSSVRRSMSSADNKVKITVSQGTVVGQTQPLPDGRQQFVFKGIPYAQAPINDLRFKPPIPLEIFPEPILDCSTERDVCFQKDMISGEFIGSENCLHLNVYTPVLGQCTKPLPVMVWIHGGAFMTGSGNSDIYSPDYLVENNVIVVTLNYRLGPFGFLCLPEAGIQGNAGLKDQLLALKWIQKNISQFCGDPMNITLFGESAGGASVHLHALSKNSKQYFHKGICQSGTAIMEWVVQQNATEKSLLLAKLLGCPDNLSQEEILQFLQTTDKPLQSFYELMLHTLTPDERRRGLPIIFKPCIEADLPDAIVTESPLDALHNPNTIEMPMIMGNNSDEGIIMLLDSYKKLDTYDSDLSRMIPKSLNLKQNTHDSEKIANDMRNLYFRGQTLSKNLINDFVHLHSDYHFGIGLHMTAELYARKQIKSKIFLYDFQHDGKLNHFKKVVAMRLQIDELSGVSHGDEIFYLFRQTQLNEHNQPICGKSLSTQIGNRMCKLWTNFAKYSDPTPSKDDANKNDLGDNLEWKSIKIIDNEIDKFNFNYLAIGDKIEMKSNPAIHRIEFWRNLYEKWNGSFLKPKL